MCDTNRKSVKRLVPTPKTMNVSLTPQLDRFVANRVASGLYCSASEVVRAALRQLDKEERVRLHPKSPPRLPKVGGGDHAGQN